MINLKGIFPPLPSPYKENGDLYPEKIQENIKKFLEHDLAGFVILGSNGELVMLTESEKQESYKNARTAIPDNKVMIAGTGGQSARETIERNKMAAGCGADAAMVLNPFYYKKLMDRPALVKYYHAVADVSDIPLIIYNIPANSGIDMDAETILEIAVHPNVIGLKDSGGNLVKMSEIVRQAPDGFQVLTGSAGVLLQALLTGAVGGILALANILPRHCLDILTEFLNGRFEQAGRVQQAVVNINLYTTAKWGIPALKHVMDELGFYGGPSRLPLQPVDEDKKLILNNLVSDFRSSGTGS